MLAFLLYSCYNKSRKRTSPIGGGGLGTPNAGVGLSTFSAETANTIFDLESATFAVGGSSGIVGGDLTSSGTSE